MNKYSILICLLIGVVGFSFADEGWEKTLEKDGITVFKKDSENSDIQSLKAYGIIHAPVEKITSILRDVDNALKWVPNLKVRKVVEDVSDTEAILYDVTDMPWPITDRDTVVHHKLTLMENKKGVILNFTSASDKLKDKTSKHVRAKIHRGYIKFIPNGKDTFVEMSILVDPRGSIPSWAVNIVQVSMPYDFLSALEKFAGKHSLPTPEGIQSLINQIDRSNKPLIIETVGK